MALLTPTPVDANAVDMIEVTEITKTGAKVTVTLGGGADSGLVYWRYRTTTPEGQWLGNDRVSVINGVAVFTLTSLIPGTEYEVQVSPDSTFPPTDSLSKSFATLAPDPFASGVSVENVTQTEATVHVTIAHPGPEPMTVYVRYRTDDSQPWSDPPVTTIATDDTATTKLSDLAPGVDYDVEASLGIGFIAGETVATTFTTLLPRVFGVRVDDVTTSGATVNVSIAEPGSRENTVHVRYRVSTSTSWDTLPSRSVAGETALYDLSGLSPGAGYEVEASLDSAFTTDVKSANFTTRSLPRIGSVNMADVGETSASAIISIIDGDGTILTIYLRYRDTSLGAWSGTQTGTSVTDTANIPLAGLTPYTEYEVEVSLESGFSEVVSAAFTTAEVRVVVSSLSFEHVTRDTATVTVGIANPGSLATVYLHYRQQGMRAWSAPETRATSYDSVRFTLTGLETDTVYEMEASLAPDFPASDTLYAAFTTAPPAGISGVRVDGLTHTGARVIVDLEDPRDRATVHLRYRARGTVAWSGPESRVTSSGGARFVLTDLIADTDYEVEATTDPNFPARNTAYETFSTAPAPAISSVRVSGVSDIGATVTVNIRGRQPGTRVFHRHRASGDQTWSIPEVRTTSTASARFTLSGLTADTEYEVEASLDGDFSVPVSKAFTTAAKGPTVSGFIGGSITPTTAEVTVNINDPQDRMTVYLRHRVWGSSAWSDPETHTASTTDATFELMGLTPGATYEIEASMDRSFSGADTVSAILTTTSVAKVSAVNVDVVTQTEARVTVSISHAEEMTRTLHLRYRELSDGDWTQSQIEVDTANAEVALSGLVPDTDYEVQASLDGSFPTVDTQSLAFRTLIAETEEPPPVSPIAVVSPKVLSFTVTEGVDNIQSAPLGIWNSLHSATMEFFLNEDIGWLSVDPGAGSSLHPEDAFAAVVKVDASGLGVGGYSGDIRVQGNAENLPMSIPVTLTVSEPSPTPEPPLIPAPASSPTPVPVPTLAPIPTAVPALAPSAPATPTHTPAPTLTPGPAQTALSTPTPGSTATPLIPPSPTPPAEEEEAETDLTLTLITVTLILMLVFVVGFFVYRKKT